MVERILARHPVQVLAPLKSGDLLALVRVIIRADKAQRGEDVLQDRDIAISSQPSRCGY